MEGNTINTDTAPVQPNSAALPENQSSCRYRKTLLCGIYLFVSLIVINFTGCFYSFSGASVPSHLKSVAIPVFDDRSGQGEPGMRETFTNRLIQKFNDDNTLRVAEKVNADALLECVIISFSDEAAVVAAGENIRQRKINISVRVVYKDLVLKKVISEKVYSNNDNYDPSAANVTQLRRDAINAAIDKITDDILIGTVSNW